MNKVLLIHGAWHNGNCWCDVANLLKKSGYEPIVLTLPGNDPDDSKDVVYEDYANHVADIIRSQASNLTIVGHSSAGHVIQMAIPKIPEKVDKVIFNNAWILPHNSCQFDFIPDEIKNGMREQAKINGDNAIPIDPGFVRHALANEATEERFEALMLKLVSQPLVLMETKINADDFSKLDIPKVMLHCAKDISAPPGAYVGMFKSLGDNPIIDVDCDHEGLFTNPKKFTEGLLKCLDI